MTLPFLQSVAPDLRRLTAPMRRFASVNGWIVGTPGRQFILDTGMYGEETDSRWRAAETSGDIAGVEAIVVTHMHRDHTGQVAALLERHDAPLFMSAEEHRRLVAASSATEAESRDRLVGFLLSLGVDAATAHATVPLDYSMLEPFPSDFVPLEDGMALSLAGRNWRVLLGGGHSPLAACLVAEDESLFFSGDQILPGPGPHITVWSHAPEADPLADYFAFLDRLTALSDTMLVLPGHGAPFTGLPAHTAKLRKSHEERLDRLAAGMSGAMTCMEMASLVFSERAAQRFADLLPGMTLSLANHLWHRGTLRRHRDDHGAYRFERVS